MPQASSHRLPRSVTPLHYELTLTPDLAAARFTGEERVRVTVHEAVDRIVLNAAELEIVSAALTDASGTTLTGSATCDEDLQQATIALDATAAPGTWTLQLTFNGILNDMLRGFYRSTFHDDTGAEHLIATTQFESTDARRAFPCWDEPDFKATFAVTLIVDDGLTAISNGAVTGETDLGNGKRQVTFAETIRMSTYLVAFVVGPFELTDPVDVDGVTLRVACVPGKRRLTPFALDIGAHALRFFRSYFGLPYPGDKLDLIAIPDFAFGAMENLGAVTFRETALLVDPDLAAHADLERVADVVAHEIAHMWFGDLVTMKWWNGIWLNEAFATLMELLCVDAFRPEWQRWVSFGVSRAAAMQVDGLRSTRTIEYPVDLPEEAEGMFDVLTYEKGASVLRMLERHLGDERFRAGVSHYLTRHSYGNAETTDLWDALEEATGEPVRTMMDSWIFHSGYPLVRAERSADGTRVTLHQEPFRYLGGGDGHRWQVPVGLRVDGEPVHTVVADDEATVDLAGKPDAVVVNHEGWGFFRVQYSPADAATALRSGLSAMERFNLVSDSWAGVVADRSPLADLVEVLRLLDDERDPDVWAAVADALGQLDRIADDRDRDALQTFVRGLARPGFDHLGWEPQAGEDDRAAKLRATLLRVLGTVGADEEIRGEAARRHDTYLADRTAVAPDLVPPIIATVARTGGRAEFDAFLERHRDPATPQEEMRYLYALSWLPSADLVRRALELAVTEVRTQNAPFAVNEAIGNPVAGMDAWGFVRERWDVMAARFPGKLLHRMVGNVQHLTSGDPAEIHRFFADHPLESGAKQLQQTLEWLDINTALRARLAGTIAAALG